MNAMMHDRVEPEISPNHSNNHHMEDDDPSQSQDPRIGYRSPNKKQHHDVGSKYICDCSIIASTLIDALECINIKREKTLTFGPSDGFDLLSTDFGSKKGPAKVYVDIEYSQKGIKLVTTLDNAMMATVEINSGNFTEYTFDPKMPSILFRVNLKDLLESLKIYNQSKAECQVSLGYPGKDKSLIMWGAHSDFLTKVALRTMDIQDMPDFSFQSFKTYFECRLGGNIFHQTLQEVIWMDDTLKMEIYEDVFIVSAEKTGFGSTKIKHKAKLRSIRDYICKEDRTETYPMYLFDQVYKSFPLRSIANLKMSMNIKGMFRASGELDNGNNQIPVEYIILSIDNNDMEDSDTESDSDDSIVGNGY